jgi:hypothetical protein
MVFTAATFQFRVDWGCGMLTAHMENYWWLRIITDLYNVISFAKFRFIFSTMDASLHFCISRVTLLWRHACRRLRRYFCCTHEYCVKHFKQDIILLGLFICYWIVCKGPSPKSATHFCTLIQRFSINFAWQRYTEDNHVLSLTGRLRQYYYRNPTKLSSQNNIPELIIGRSQWPRGLRRRFGAALLLGLWVRVPPGAWMFFSCECFVFSGRSLVRADDSSRGVLSNVVRRRVWSRNVKNEEAMPHIGFQRHGICIYPVTLVFSWIS